MHYKWLTKLPRKPNLNIFVINSNRKHLHKTRHPSCLLSQTTLKGPPPAYPGTSRIWLIEIIQSILAQRSKFLFGLSRRILFKNPRIIRWRAWAKILRPSLCLINSKKLFRILWIGRSKTYKKVWLSTDITLIKLWHFWNLFIQKNSYQLSHADISSIKIYPPVGVK